MEKLTSLLPGASFLTRAIVFLGEDWYPPNYLAGEHVGYGPKFDCKTAVRRQLKDMDGGRVADRNHHM